MDKTNTKENVFLVGDTTFDEISAKEAGIKFIAVKSKTGREQNFRNPDFIINDIGEVLDIIK